MAQIEEKFLVSSSSILRVIPRTLHREVEKYSTKKSPTRSDGRIQLKLALTSALRRTRADIHVIDGAALSRRVFAGTE